jgi:hypothetical protein
MRIVMPAFLASGKPVSQVLVFDVANYHAPPFKAKSPAYLVNNIFRI